MPKFRKKSIVIDAITFDQLVDHGKNQLLPGELVNGMPWSFTYGGHAVTHHSDDCYLIPTLEGTMRFTRGDMLITGVQGEIYPCKADIFAATYDVELAPHQQRVVDEKRELDEKVTKLAAFAQPSNDVFQKLPNAECGRLVYQLSIMREYSTVLGDRIAAFTA